MFFFVIATISDYIPLVVSEAEAVVEDQEGGVVVEMTGVEGDEEDLGPSEIGTTRMGEAGDY